MLSITLLSLKGNTRMDTMFLSEENFNYICTRYKPILIEENVEELEAHWVIVRLIREDKKFPDVAEDFLYKGQGGRDHHKESRCPR